MEIIDEENRKRVKAIEEKKKEGLLSTIKELLN